MAKSRRLVPRRVRPIRARRRRTPEVAREELLDAAERVFGEFQPDQVGLKDVAGEAGVSHALITHYFGSFAGLIEATLERRVRALREQLLARLEQAGGLARPAEMLGMLFSALGTTTADRWLLAANGPVPRTHSHSGTRAAGSDPWRARRTPPPRELVGSDRAGAAHGGVGCVRRAIGKYAGRCVRPSADARARRSGAPHAGRRSGAPPARARAVMSRPV